jgi:hypothetical protein
MLISYVELFIFLGAIGLAYYISNRLWPIEHFSGVTLLPEDELSKRYKSTFKSSIIGICVLTPILIWCIHWLLQFSILFRLGFLYDVTFLVLPAKYAIVLLALLIGTWISTVLITAIINNTILADWEDYLYYVNKQFKFNVVTCFYYFKRITFFVVIALLYLTYDWFSAFGNEEIKINTFWGVGTAKYQYNHVSEIIEIHQQGANQEENTYFKIYFKDGTIWNSKYQGFDHYKQNKQAIWYTSERSGLPVKDIHIE